MGVSKKTNIFLSYSHKDENYKEAIDTHLYSLRMQAIIKEWHDRKIVACAKWKHVISKNLKAADIVLMLISADFISSDYCYEKEFKYSVKEKMVIPIICRPCDWKHTDLEDFQALPKDGKPISKWRNRDDAYLDVVKGIRNTIIKIGISGIPKTIYLPSGTVETSSTTMASKKCQYFVFLKGEIKKKDIDVAKIERALQRVTNDKTLKIKIMRGSIKLAVKGTRKGYEQFKSEQVLGRIGSLSGYVIEDLFLKEKTVKPDLEKAPSVDQWDDQRSPNDLENLLIERKYDTAENLLRVFLDDIDKFPRVIPLKTAAKVLTNLRKYAWFEWLYKAAYKIESYGQCAIKVQRLLAQAKIEHGHLTDAIDGLIKLKSKIEERTEKKSVSSKEYKDLQLELGESLGLLGRSYKQLYINAKPNQVEQREYDLKQSLYYYNKAYKEKLGDYLWCGVNYIALKTHAERIDKDSDMALSKSAQTNAKSILTSLEMREDTLRKEKKTLEAYDRAKFVEAYLALGKTKEAVSSLLRYLEHKDINAFEVQSTQRQLLELWMLNEKKQPGMEILPIMKAKFSKLGGMHKNLILETDNYVKYERIWNDTKYEPLEFLLNAIKRARGVARIGPNKHTAERSGTGFLFDGELIGDNFKNQNLFLTNAHVCSSKWSKAASPEECWILFLGMGSQDPPVVKVIRELWTSLPDDLDATLLEIDTPPSGIELPKLADPPPLPKERVNILGYPKGLGLQVSMQDNTVVDITKQYIHYKTPTDEGSSGSPVFNQDWELVALHHASVEKIEANEGILMPKIIKEIQRNL